MTKKRTKTCIYPSNSHPTEHYAMPPPILPIFYFSTDAGNDHDDVNRKIQWFSYKPYIIYGVYMVLHTPTKKVQQFSQN